MRALALGVLAALVLLLAALAFGADRGPTEAPPATCRSVSFDSAPFVVCSARRDADIRLMLRGEDRQPLGTFDAAQARLPQGDALVMVMNAGMYHADRRAVGLYVEDSEAQALLVTRAGPGNFGMTPNGVFWSDGTTVHVTETLAFAEQDIQPDFATQSGPMLVIDGALHPRFKPDSESRKRRNGVGVSDSQVHFAISDAPVNFHHFARLFRDELGVDNALFLDGSISRIRAPELGRDERGSPLGPMVLLVGGTESRSQNGSKDGS